MAIQTIMQPLSEVDRAILDGEDEGFVKIHVKQGTDKILGATIVAAHAGLRTLGFSIVTDLCLPDALEPVNIEKILEVAGQGGKRLAKLIPRVFERLD